MTGVPETAEPPAPETTLPEKKTVVKELTVERLTPMYRVLIHNDDVTHMDFVVKVLVDVFKKSFFEASRIMLTAHFKKVALVAILPLEQAELRIDQGHSMARAAKFPLTFTCEPE